MKKNNNHDSKLTDALNSILVNNAKKYAIKCHRETNHKYDGKPYEIHLQMVVEYACKYSYLIDENFLEEIIASAWTHDTIEDCRQTYNDVKKKLGFEVAEITYALTNEKGKNRNERANSSYYRGIRNTYLATYVKICDRLANVKYSKLKNSKMIEAYKKENKKFMQELYTIELNPMWLELSALLN